MVALQRKEGYFTGSLCSLALLNGKGGTERRSASKVSDLGTGKERKVVLHEAKNTDNGSKPHCPIPMEMDSWEASEGHDLLCCSRAVGWCVPSIGMVYRSTLCLLHWKATV